MNNDTGRVMFSILTQNVNTYEGHLESSWHGIITPQCVDKMLSNNTFLETRIQRLLDGLIYVKKKVGVHVQRMLKIGRGLYTGRNFKQNTWKKAKENWGPYLRSWFEKLTIWCQLVFYQKILIDPWLQEYHLYIWKMLTRNGKLSKMGHFFDFSLNVYYKLCHYRSTKNAYRVYVLLY